MGLASSGHCPIRPDDIAAIILGGDMPFILQEEVGNGHILVCEAFVKDRMQGEIFEGLDADETHPNTVIFKLV